MNSNYHIIRTNYFNEDYAQEYDYSINCWGLSHAQRFFDELDEKIDSLSQNPHMYLKKPEMPEDIRYFIHKKGIYVIFEIDDTKKEVRLLGLLGKNRFHKLSEFFKK